MLLPFTITISGTFGDEYAHPVFGCSIESILRSKFRRDRIIRSQFLDARANVCQSDVAQAEPARIIADVSGQRDEIGSLI